MGCNENAFVKSIGFWAICLNKICSEIKRILAAFVIVINQTYGQNS